MYPFCLENCLQMVQKRIAWGMNVIFRYFGPISRMALAPILASKMDWENSLDGLHRERKILFIGEHNVWKFVTSVPMMQRFRSVKVQFFEQLSWVHALFGVWTAWVWYHFPIYVPSLHRWGWYSYLFCYLIRTASRISTNSVSHFLDSFFLVATSWSVVRTNCIILYLQLQHYASSPWCKTSFSVKFISKCFYISLKCHHFNFQAAVICGLADIAVWSWYQNLSISLYYNVFRDTSLCLCTRREITCTLHSIRLVFCNQNWVEEMNEPMTWKKKANRQQP